MGVSAYLTVQAQWNYIVSILRAQQNVSNAGVPGAGTNASGTLQSIKIVGSSIWPEFNSLPYVGVQLDSWKEELDASQRRHLVTSRFEVIIAVTVQSSGANLIQLSSAMSQLASLIDDGAGNGVLPILGKNANFTLGGNAFQSLTTGGKLYWDKNPVGKGTEYIAYTLLGLSAWQKVQRTT